MPVSSSTLAPERYSTGRPSERQNATRACKVASAVAEWAGCSQPVCAASQTMPYFCAVAKTRSPPRATSESSARPRSSPRRPSTACGSASEKFGTTKPPLTPLAPAPISRASRTTTLAPRSMRCSAAVNPVKPAPTMATSATTSPSRGATGGASSAVAHQSVLLVSGSMQHPLAGRLPALKAHPMHVRDGQSQWR